MSAVIRQAEPGDLAAVEALLTAERLVLEGLDMRPYLLVAVDEDVVVGAVGIECHDGAALLRSLVVAPSHRGTGLGARLTEAAVDMARHDGMAPVYLLTETAEAFFASRGFEAIPRDDAEEGIAASYEFREACPASAVLMRRHVW